MLPCSGVSYGGSGLVCVITGGEELTAPVKRAARVRERAQGGGGMVVELTAISTEDSAGSGRGRSKRGGEGDLRRPMAWMRMMASLRASRERVLRLGAPWRRGGASGQHGEVRERRWPRWCSSAAVACERARGGEELGERVRGLGGGAWLSPWH